MQKYFNTIVNDSGTGLNGALVRVTQSSGIVASIYSDNGVTPAANPLISDGSGNFQFYVADGTYTLTITYNGKVVKTLAGVVLGSDAASNEDLTALAANLTNINAAASNLSAINTAAQNIAAIQGAAGNAQAAAASATAAQAAQTAATAARDSANTTGKVFSDTTTGIAGTTNGQTFSVVDASLQFWIVYKNNAGAALELARSYTKAYIDQIADRSVDRYFQGKLVIFARVDAQSRGGDVITADGQHYAKYAIRGTNGVAVAVAADGFYQLSLGLADTLSFSNGNTLGGLSQYYFQGKKVTWARADNISRASIIETEDGGVYIPKLTSPALDSAGSSAPLETNSFVYDTASVAGLRQVFRTSKTSGIRSQATATGDNWSPRLSADGAKVIYSTNRNGAQEGYYQLLGGTKYGGAVEHPIFPKKSVMPLGDSLTAADYASTVAASLGTTLVVPSASEKAGIGSQTSTQIAARFGAIALTCSLAGNVMSAGANTLSDISVQMLSRVADVNGTVRTLRAAILGIAGTLTSTQSPTSVPGALVFSGQWYSYTFTPDAWQALPGSVPTGSALVIDPEDRQDSILLVWVGRNDVGGAAGWQATLKSNIAAIFAAYKPLVRRIALLSVTNSTSEPSGTQNYNDIVALNADLLALYPDSFVDVRTPYNAGTATDIPAPDKTSDGLHYNGGAGKTAIATAVTNFITSKGWF